MRTSILLRRGAALPCLVSSLALAAACAAPRPPARPPSDAVLAPAPAAPEGAPNGEAPPVDPTPAVIRRIAAEQHDLVASSQSMARELRDTRGRQRALAEAAELAADLGRLVERIDGADSDELDAVVTALARLDTRITLLHEKLLTATDRTRAAVLE